VLLNVLIHCLSGNEIYCGVFSFLINLGHRLQQLIFFLLGLFLLLLLLFCFLSLELFFLLFLLS
jgi:hypothetical protein